MGSKDVTSCFACGAEKLSNSFVFPCALLIEKGIPSEKLDKNLLDFCSFRISFDTKIAAAFNKSSKEPSILLLMLLVPTLKVIGLADIDRAMSSVIVDVYARFFRNH